MSTTEARVTALGGGIHQVTMPLPWSLDHVHCYAIEDAEGWTIVDTGLGAPATARRWSEALAALGSPSVRRIVVTHHHPDHVGAGAALVELTGAPEVVQGRYDAVLTRRAWGEEQDMGAFEHYLLHHGMPAEVASRSVAEEASTPVALAPPTRLVDEGDTLDLAGEEFRVLVLPGHADGHIVLYAQGSGRMFGGDVLLHGITPNVGRWQDTQPDPLGRYLGTLDRIQEIAPLLVFPGHRSMIDDAATRAAEIAVHHGHRLDAHLDALRGGATTAYEVSGLVWNGNLGTHEQRFAFVEAIAHLEHLAVEGRADEFAPGRWRAA